MKFYPLTEPAQKEEYISSEYRSAREIGVVRLGEGYLYFRKSRKIYYIPYQDIRRCFRRVMAVPMKMCCGKGNFEIENLVICGDEGELAQVQLPGTRAAKILMEELKSRIPDASFTCPDKRPQED